ncbi:FecR family protein [Dyadobacter psychrophilus]|uniref:FecR family protein n=1 Tax=Dyadobacter psychrophilus TaxID=651661 RepID=A0A1T5EJ33_9BACT|nr:FecR family protein [Dyadobacter psychrophilus]SKB83845.1 FecR family protein [Dyadobacter psychrophilus]
MDYRYHTAEELATDDLFRKWVTSPTPEITSFWLKWIADNPEKSVEVGMARELVLAVYDIHTDDLTEETLQHEIAEITRLAEIQKQNTNTNIYRLVRQPFWRVAAIFLLVSAIGLWLYSRENNAASPSAARHNHTRAAEMLIRENTGSHEMTVLLSDNSVATLSPGSIIRFPKTFAAGERKVILTGEAFFDVARNPKRPFLVYANETVTKVLGTSFRVKALDQENTVMVLVKTGRVSVYPKTEYETLQNKPHKKVSVIVLDPNQQAVFNRKENKLEKGIVINRQLLSELSVQKELIFDDKPVSQVFKSLQDMYGIAIDYNQEMLADCIISAQFSDENLKQRLSAICQAIGAGYEMVDGRIVITSKGCS